MKYDKQQELKALFWCDLLRPILFEEIGEQHPHAYLVQLSQEECLFPNGIRKKPSLSTLKRKLKMFQKGGIEQLKRKKRSDRGQPRRYSSDIVEKVVEYKKDLPTRSAHTINAFLLENHKIEIPESTLYRYLRAHNATRTKLNVVKKKVRCRWTRDNANDLWIGDFANGPYVMHEGDIKETYLSLFIDCQSRYVVQGQYYIKQSLDILIDTLLKGFCKHGLPNDLYLDNAKVYHATALKSACYDLNIRLLHRKVRDPAPGGLVERLFLSGQRQFEEEVRAGDILTLAKLNESFNSWLEMAYHNRVHSELKQEPSRAYQKAIHRPVDSNAVLRFFMSKVERTVHSVFSDISLDHHFYQVDKRYRGDRVWVHYDPFSNRKEVLIYNQQEAYLQKAPHYEREKRADAEAGAVPQSKPKYNYLELLNQKHQRKIQADTTQMDFTQIDQRWPFTAFTGCLASLMGKSGSHAFDEEQLTLLKQNWDRYPSLNAAQVIAAFERADIKNINHFILQLGK
jgi:putative transposase